MFAKVVPSTQRLEVQVKAPRGLEGEHSAEVAVVVCEEAGAR